jgi:hypothetical protein
MTEPLIDGGEALRPEDAPAEPAAPEQIASEPASEPLAPSGEVDELDKLLAEWDAQNPPAAPGLDPQPQLDYREQIWQASVQGLVEREKLAAQAAGIERGFQLAQELQEENRLLGEMADDAGVSPEIVRGVVEQMAKDEATRERIAGAWQSRATNRAGLDRLRAEVVGKVKRSIRPQIDERVTEDVAAVAAAVRGSVSEKSMPAEPPPNLSHMSDQELAYYTRTNFGFG